MEYKNPLSYEINIISTDALATYGDMVLTKVAWCIPVSAIEVLNQCYQEQHRNVSVCDTGCDTR